MTQSVVLKRILCLGNDIVGDDGVGLAIGRALLGARLPPGVSVELAGHLDLDLLSTLERAQELLVVDAEQRGEPPGRCGLRRLDLAAGSAPLTLHALDLATLLALARRLIPERLPGRLDLLSVEVGPLDHFGEDLSPAVAAAVPRGVELALSWVRRA